MKKLYIMALTAMMIAFVVTAVANADNYKDKLTEETALNFLEFNGCKDVEGIEKVEEGFVVKCKHEFSAIFDVESTEYILLYSADPTKPYTRDVYDSE